MCSSEMPHFSMENQSEGNYHTSAGTIGAFTAVEASSPFKAPTTASAISMATPSWEITKKLEYSFLGYSCNKCMIINNRFYPNLGFRGARTQMRRYCNLFVQDQLIVCRRRLLGKDIQRCLLNRKRMEQRKSETMMKKIVSQTAN